MSSRTSTALTIAGATVVGGLVAYAVYFDYKRRNDVEFRKKLRKEKKRVEKASASAGSGSASSSVNADDLRAAIAKIAEEPVPDSPTAKEQYFMTQVSLGEQLASQGPALAIPAAIAFFKALRVYPSPVELLMIYQKTVPPEVFQVIVELSNLDAKSLAEGYYEHFPAKSFNVSVQLRGAAKKHVLIANRAFGAGDVIYTEEALVAVLDPDLQEQGTYCTHCLRLIHKATAITPESDLLSAVYCSPECQHKSKVQSHGVLFTTDPVLPPELDDKSAADIATRAEAQKAFAEYAKSTKKSGPLLVARYAARQVALEVAKLSPGSTDPEQKALPPYIETSTAYALGDHFERLRYVDVKTTDEEGKLIREVFSAALPGVEQFLTEDRHAILLGKMAYNAYGICYSGGRDDRPVFHDRPEDQERTRTPHGTTRQIGAGLYVVSAYISHSCDPNCKPSFKSGTSDLHLVATRPIQKGEEITVAYVDVTQHPEESAEDARRRRRQELARGWRFKCECSRCRSEAESSGVVENDMDGVDKDGSKLEAAIERFANGSAGDNPSAADTD